MNKLDLQASKSFEHTRTERSGFPDIQNPAVRALAVPDWLSSPRSSSAASWQSSDTEASGSVTAEPSLVSPRRRRNGRHSSTTHGAFASSEPSSETLTDARHGRYSQRFSGDSQGQADATGRLQPEHAVEASGSGGVKLQVLAPFPLLFCSHQPCIVIPQTQASLDMLHISCKGDG